jgi:polyisoprenoid-binding protein YceI
MAAPGRYVLGPTDGTLTVATGKGGAAARAAHNLSILVGRWEATLELGGDPVDSSISLTADARSLRVVDGSGGMSALDEDDKAGISKTIDDEVLQGNAITFRSTSVSGANGSGRLLVHGALELGGATNPVDCELTVADDGRVTGTATVTQTAHGIKPYTALFGTLKVSDDVSVSVDAQLGEPA